MNNKTKNYKIVIIGDAAVGKTMISNAILNVPFREEYQPSVGASIVNIQYTNDLTGDTFCISLWDTAGQEEYRSLVNIYFRESNVVLIIFDLTSHKSFEDVDEWIDEIFANCGEPLPTLLIVGNKSDCDHVVKKDDAQAIADNYQINYFETSALNGSNINDVFKYVHFKKKDIFFIKSNNIN